MYLSTPCHGFISNREISKWLLMALRPKSQSPARRDLRSRDCAFSFTLVLSDDLAQSAFREFARHGPPSRLPASPVSWILARSVDGLSEHFSCFLQRQEPRHYVPHHWSNISLDRRR